MAQENRWFGWVKRLFVSKEKPKAEKKKSKKCRWVLERSKFRKYPALPEPESRVDETAEKHRKYALTVALATAAAAEAAVAAAQAAAEVVRLTTVSQSYITKGDVNLAATKIQSAFRAHLARKALRALKALVKLQAIARGQAVRRKTAFKLRHFQSKGKILSEDQGKNIYSLDSICKYSAQKKVLKSSLDLEEKESKPFQCHSQTSWDYSILSKQDAEAIWFTKEEANLRRERMLKYSFSQQERRNNQLLAESPHGKRSGRHIYLLEKWAKKEPRLKEKGIENWKPVALGTVKTDVKTSRKQELFDGLNSQPVSFPRRSFDRSKWSTALTESSAPNSPVFPTYMAATQSAMAKARSLSTPKRRVAVQDNFFDRSSSHRNDPLVWASYNGEPFGTKGKCGVNFQHTSTGVNLYY